MLSIILGKWAGPGIAMFRFVHNISLKPVPNAKKFLRISDCT